MSAQIVGRNAERFRRLPTHATAFGGTALRSALRAMTLFAVCPVTLLLVGCVSTIPTPGSPSENMGTLVVSVGSKSPFGASAHKLQIRDPRTGAFTEAIYLENNMFRTTPRVVDTPEENVGVLTVNLPAGEYSVYDIVTNFAGYPASISFQSKTEFSIPFSIRRGEITYIGQFLAHRVVGKNILGRDIPAGTYFVVSDEQDRDMRALSSQSPTAGSRIVSKQLADPRRAKNPMIRSE
jgi:hypothetical protein